MLYFAHLMDFGDRPIFIMQLTLLLVLVATVPTLGQESDCMASGQNLSLNVYVYDTGKALVAGYVEDPRGLIFLGASQLNVIGQNQNRPKYSYYDDTGQIYAWTDALTRKNGENWSLVFAPWGFYREWRTVFHLPGDLRLGRINSSTGMNYMIFTSNESLLVETRAYHVRNPSIVIEYQQPLGGEPRENMPEWETSLSSGSQNIFMIAAIISILAAVSAFAFAARRRREKLSPGEADQTDLPTTVRLPEADPPEDVAEDEREDEAEDGIGDGAEPGGICPVEEDQKKEIKVSREMAAVMETLTPRERSILETLIRHGGRMTQMEMRYETGSPKSSLAMILISLEKRKLITKREWGRTNVIELSEWFLSKEEPS